MTIKAVIFDLDGLLIDTEPYWTWADNKILGREGYSLTPDLIQKRLGRGATGALEIYHKKFPFKYSFKDFIIERRQMAFKLMDKKIPVMVGAKEILKKCFDRGLKLGIATSGPHRQRMPKILQALDASDYISVFVTGNEVQAQKPLPDIFLLTSKKLGVKPGNCLVLEDAPAGIQAAKAAGMKAFGVNKDNDTRKALKNSGADEVFTSLSEIDINKL